MDVHMPKERQRRYELRGQARQSKVDAGRRWFSQGEPEWEAAMRAGDGEPACTLQRGEAAVSCVDIQPQLRLFQQVKGDHDISETTATSSDGSGGCPVTGP